MWDEASADPHCVFSLDEKVVHDNDFHENEMKENKLPSDYYMV